MPGPGVTIATRVGLSFERVGISCESNFLKVVLNIEVPFFVKLVFKGDSARFAG